jgi:hypothetical protein
MHVARKSGERAKFFHEVEQGSDIGGLLVSVGQFALKICYGLDMTFQRSRPWAAAAELPVASGASPE